MQAEGDDPVTYTAAVDGVDGTEWKAAVNREREALRRTGTWQFAEVPEGRRPLATKWVFTTKRDAAGTPTKRKARLVAKGFLQKPGVDFKGVYAPVVRPSSLRTRHHTRFKYILGQFLTRVGHTVEVESELPSSDPDTAPPRCIADLLVSDVAARRSAYVDLAITCPVASAHLTAAARRRGAAACALRRVKERRYAKSMASLPCCRGSLTLVPAFHRGKLWSRGKFGFVVAAKMFC